MRDHCFYLDGMSSLDFGIRLQEPLSFHTPSRKFESVSVPGRNGELHIVQNAFDSVKAKAKCFVFGAQQDAGAAAAWLLSTGEKRKLETPEDPQYYRLACVFSGYDAQARMNRLYVFDIDFIANPQRYRKDGGYPLAFAQNGVLFNTERFPARPLIHMYGNGPGTLSIGGTVISLLSLDQSVTLDSETQNAYKGTQNKNSTIRAPVFPSLVPGENEIAFTGGISRIEIIPRWWTL